MDGFPRQPEFGATSRLRDGTLISILSSLEVNVLPCCFSATVFDPDPIVDAPIESA
jgi:hypothetical protein